MAATLVSAKRQLSDSCDLSSSGGLKETIPFIVTVTQSDSHPWEVASLSGTGTTPVDSLPAFGEAHESGANSICVKKTAKRYKGSGPQPRKDTWIVEVSYEPKVLGGGPTSDTDDSRNIRISVTGAKETIYTQAAWDGDMNQVPITNALDDLYPDAQEITLYDERIEISFEKDAIDGDGLAGLRGKINDSEVTFSLPQGDLTVTRSFATHTVLLDELDYEVTVSLSDPTSHVFTIKVVLIVRFDGWDKTLPQKGFRWKSEAGDLTDWKDNAAYLDEDGNKLSPGDLLATTEPVQLYQEADLAGFLSTI